MEFEFLLALYTEAMRWTEKDEIGGAEFSSELMAKCREDVTVFIAQAQNLLTGPSEQARAMADFWLTRNGHGAGFWDGDWPEHGDELTELCCKFPAVDLYLGDDGLVYC